MENVRKQKSSHQDDTIRAVNIKISFHFLLLSIVISFLVSFGTGVVVSTFLYTNESDLAFLKKEATDLLVSIQSDDLLQSNDNNEDDDEDEDDEDDDDEEDLEEIERSYYFPGASHQVKGQVDNVNSSFLSSPEKLAKMIMNIVDNTSLTLLSHHCTHISSNVGVNCIGILSDKSQIAFHTYRDESNHLGVLLFNTFWGGPDQYKDANLFAPLLEKNIMNHIPLSSRQNRNIKWKLNYISQRQRLNDRNPYNDDLGDERFLYNENVMKTFVKSVHTPFQRIDVYDFVDPKHTNHEDYYRSLTQDGSYPSLHPELFHPNRVIFLDGVMQSLSRGNEVYHEALVQPAMFAHKNPRRIAIIGGGEGATLREALKHKSVEKVLMIDIDEIMCKESASLLYPAWNGCDDFGPTASCFDDPRADVRYEDALAWFMDRYSDDDLESYGDEEEEEDSSDDDESGANEEEDSSDDESGANDEESFDIIVMDALDPQDTIEFAVALYQNKVFWNSLYNALSDDGILVAQLGDAPDLIDPAEQHTEQKNRVAVIKTLTEVGFQSLHFYEEAHCGFEFAWTFLVACKSHECRSNFYASPAKIQHAIHHRIHRSKSGNPLLKYFDGSTMASYNLPHRAFEVVYCRSNPMPEECKLGPGFHLNIPRFSNDAFDIDADGKGTVKIKARMDIPQNSYIGTADIFPIPSLTRKLISKMWQNMIDVVRPLENFMNKFGMSSAQTRRDDLYLSSGLPSLIPYEVNATANVKPLGSLLKQNINYDSKDVYEERINAYSPLVDRHISLFTFGFFTTVKDVFMGQEMMASPN